MSTYTLQNWKKDFNLFKFNTKIFLAGWYFTLLGKKTKVLDGVEVLVPREKVNLKLRGQFQIGFYERHERRHLKKYIQPDATVLELGGCLGVVSCITNKLLSNPRQHVVVEANPEMIQSIEQNRAFTHSAFSIENCIISQNRENVFYVNSEIGGSSMRRRSERAIVVPGKTLSELEDKYQLVFDTVIMDIEGAELEFLRENREWLRQVNLIILEVHPHPENLSDEEVAECRQILEEAGLPIVVVDQYVWVAQRKQIANSN